MSLSGAPNMRQNRNPCRPCSANRDPSLWLFPANTTKIALTIQIFSSLLGYPVARYIHRDFIEWVLHAIGRLYHFDSKLCGVRRHREIAEPL